MRKYIKNNEDESIDIGKSDERDLSVSKSRLFVVIAVFAIAFSVLSFRVIAVSVLGDYNVSYATADDYGHPVVHKSRGDIVDRNGVLLAVNLSTASLYANPKVVMNPKIAAKKISTVFPELDKADLLDKLASNKSFVWIKRNLTPEEQYKVNALGLPGLMFKEEETRVYPHRNLLSHIVGLVDIDGKGITALEATFDDYLKDNNSLKLSIDVRAQGIVRDALMRAMDEFKALGASAIVLDADTGELISMVSLPDFNLNDPSSAKSEERFNRSTLGVYEMGSTFKTFNMALGYELGGIGMTQQYDVSKPLKVASFTINDFHQKKPVMTAPEIYMYSSNIGSAKIAMDIGAESQKTFLDRLGLLSGLDVEIPEKSEPLIPSRWGKISAMTVSYGHGIAVTPLHITKATAALVNGGILRPATLLYKEKQPEGVRVISQENSDYIRKLMRLAVKYGTGSNADVAGYLVGGKTGSAEKPNHGKYNRKANIASFMGAFPMNNPKYVVFVMVDEPVGNASTGWYTTGGMIAAPVVYDIISRVAPVLGVMPVDEESYEIRKEFWYDDEKGQQVALAESD